MILDSRVRDLTRLLPPFDYRLRDGQSLINVEDYRRAARRRVPPMVWTFIDGGADDLVTLRDNCSAFERWTLRSRALRGHVTRNLSTTVAGRSLALPVMLAPTGFAGLTHWRGDVASAAAAERAGTRQILSTASSWTIEEVSRATREDHFFQLYPRESEITASLIQRAAAAGYGAMFVTVDVPVVGNREGERRLGMGSPPVLTPRRAIAMARHPRWVRDVLVHDRTAGRNLVSGGDLAAAIRSVQAHERHFWRPSLSWDDLAWIREQWSGPLYVKGILDPGDARRVVDLGLDGVVVSNHGGRQLDGAPATLDVLESIVAAIGGRGEVLLDGGIRRGTDIVKALALGARAVLIGRPYLYGLAVAGEEGVAAILELLRVELDRALTLMGVGDVAELDRSWVTPRGAEDPEPDVAQPTG